MNLKMYDKKLFTKLVDDSYIRITVGSKLYKNNIEESDTDYLYILPDKKLNSKQILQYTDINDHMFIPISEYISSLINGASTINFESIYSDDIKHDNILNFLYEKRNWFNTYNIRRAYLGLAKRDLDYILKRKYDSKKIFHTFRGYFFYHLLKYNTFDNFNHVSTWMEIKQLSTYLKTKSLKQEIEILRKQLNTDLQLHNINKTLDNDQISELNILINKINTIKD